VFNNTTIRFFENSEVDRRKLKILYISHSIGMDGSERCLFNLLKYLDRNKFIPIVVLPGDGPLKKKLECIGVKTIIAPLVWWIPLIRDVVSNNLGDIMDRCNKLAALIEEEDIDIVHTNTSVIAEGAIAAKMTGRPHIWHLHEILNGHPSLRPSIPLYLTYRLIDLLSDLVVVVSQTLKKAVSEGISPEMIKVIYNGVDSTGGSESEIEKPFRPEIKLSDNYILVCTVGPIIKEKGYHTFVEAAKRVLEKKNNMRFISVGNIGDFNLLLSLRSKIRDGISEKKFQFLGYRSDIWRILKEIDIYIVSSETESFGLTMVEAMAAGKPVIATRCGGPEEIVVDGETGLLVPINDPDALAEAIISLANDPGKRHQMGLSGKRHYEALFTAEKYCNAFENLYTELKEKRILNIEEEKLANSLIELLFNKNKFYSTSHVLKRTFRRVTIFLKYRYFLIWQYVEIWRSMGFIAANRRVIKTITSKIVILINRQWTKTR